MPDASATILPTIFPADDAPKLTWALHWARFGIPVSPAFGTDADGACDCGKSEDHPRGKHPATFHGHNDATRDESQIREWWREYPNANIVGAIGAGGFVAADLDLKNNKDGFASLGDLEIEYGDMPPTLTFETASGNSHHLLFRGATASRNGLRPGLDVKSTGGFIIMPGSTIGATRYRVLQNRPVAECPAWFSALIGQPRERDLSKKTDATEDLDGAPERFAEWLRHLPPPTDGKRNDTVAKIIAPRANDMGVTAETAIALTCGIWNAKDGADSLDESEIAKTIESGMRSAENPFGYLTELHTSMGLLDRVAGAAEPVDDGPIAWRDLRHMPSMPLAWLWEWLVLQGHPNLVSGDAKVGKSLLMIYIAVAIACGKSLFGRATIKAPVLLVLCEDTRDEVIGRIAEACRELGVTEAEQDAMVLDVWVRVGLDSRLAVISDDGTITHADFYKDVTGWIAANPAPFVVLDHALDIVSMNQNLDAPVNAFGKVLLGGMCAATGATIAILKHPSSAGMSAGTFVGNSVEWRGAFRHGIILRKPSVKNGVYKGPERILETGAANYAADSAITLHISQRVISIRAGADQQDRERRDIDLVFDAIAELRKNDVPVVMSQGAGRKPKDIAKSIEKDTGVVMIAWQVKDHINTLEDGLRIHYRKRVGGKNPKPATFEIGPPPDANRGAMMLAALASYAKTAASKGRLSPGVEFSLSLPEACAWLVERHRAESIEDAEMAIRQQLGDRTVHPVSRGVTGRLMAVEGGTMIVFQYGKRPLMPAETATE